MLRKDGQVRVNNARDFVNVAQESLKKTKLIYCDKAYVEKFNNDHKLFDEVIKVPGIQKTHIIKVFPDGRFEFAANALSTLDLS